MSSNPILLHYRNAALVCNKYPLKFPARDEDESIQG